MSVCIQNVLLADSIIVNILKWAIINIQNKIRQSNILDNEEFMISFREKLSLKRGLGIYKYIANVSYAELNYKAGFGDESKK